MKNPYLFIRLLFVVFIVAVGFIPTNLQAHSFTIDQINDSFPSACHQIQGGTPIGQEFVPTLSSLDVIELMTADFDAPGGGVDLLVYVREGSINGPIIGTSSTLHLPSQVVGDYVEAHFDFPTSVPLVPGNLYVMQVIAVAGEFWGLCGPATDTYPQGTYIFQGTPFGSDLWFREGPALPVDTDNDGVMDNVDMCPNTTIPESVPTVKLGKNRWALRGQQKDGVYVFETAENNPAKSYTIGQTAGCSCQQIITALGLGEGHTKFGCSNSAMDEWISRVSNR